MKKLILPLLGLWILAALFIFYPEFKTRNFMDAFITSPENVEEVVQGINIRKDGGIVAILKPTDEKYDEVLAELRSWEVKKAMFKDMDYSQEIVELDIMTDGKQLNSFHMAITNNGMIDIRGKEYELVDGSSIEEIIEVVK
ncbi:hypothetical protein [Ureibacillus aquaedulcis]|uniref:DUF4252 domain-containing protein n=1 Tax=Ureibacillus aquaedulcis TaxID=3058421 RepID=A0ABT8GT40_9BACL|nr:hypothetical protein [Ureibacillus sp. BA0131]MDN4494399.1 hypothetical protein [Ureibacillus sp. BA0131]